MWGIEIVIVLAMIAVNSVFAGYEIALAAIALPRLRQLEREHRRGASAALRMKENMEGSLAVVQLGITLVGAIAAATGGASAEERIAPSLESALGLSEAWSELTAIALIVLPLTLVTIVFGELIPKVFALRNPEWVCLRLSPGMRVFAYSVWPAVWFLETAVSKIMSWGTRHMTAGSEPASESTALQELRASAQLARTARLIGQREEHIILGAARLARQSVRDTMLPADAISLLGIDQSMADALVHAHLDMHTRFPVAERAGDPQAIVGYVNFKDIVASLRQTPGPTSLRAIVRPIPWLPDALCLSDCLERMIHDHTHIALVHDRRRQVVGLITLEDILEELVGDIRDEYDRLPTHLSKAGSGWIAGGGLPLQRMRLASGWRIAWDENPNPASTLNDWVSARLGRPVRKGDEVRADGVRLLVRKVRRHQVLEAYLETLSPAPREQ